MAERTFLLVEDNPADVELARLAFERAGLGVRIDHAHDGVEALAYLLPRPAEGTPGRTLPTVVLLDLKLPRMGGLQVLERLRADPRTKLLPVVVLTSSSHPSDVASSYRLGCNSYVRKPVDFARFLDMVRYLGTYWLELNEPPQELP
jgi:two-component system response regulator